jgi:alkylhydroperoxidase/carboxymuconolactone decarboxylase family protein YurZ
MTVPDLADDGRITKLGLPAVYAEALGGFLTSPLDGTSGLPAKIRHLALALAYSNKGSAVLSKEHGARAIADGLTRDEAIEALMAGVLARGAGTLWNNLWLAEQAPVGAGYEPEASTPADTAAILQYMGQAFGSVPQWGELLSGASPSTFEAYYQLRAVVFRDAALPRRYKELLLVTLNCTERYEVGIGVHARGALTAGASRAELLDAVRTSIISGGIVAWLAGSEHAQAALDEAGL